MIPDYQTLMLPVLQEAADGEVSTRDVIETLSEKYALSDEEREQLLPSGKQRTFDNRVNWAKGYLKQAGLVRYTKRGFYVVTDEGQKVLAQNPDRIDNKFLKQFDAFLEFQSRKGPQSAENQDESLDEVQDDATPDEILRAAHAKINASLASDLLDRIRGASPQFFEHLIIELLLAMGYGGTSEDAARALGQSGDNGVDGVVDQDPLGVDQIYVQAKRYAEGNNVGAGDIRDFFGALNLKKAQKGLFFTTSGFSPSAKQTAKDLGMRIVLIDGQHLTKLMIRYSIGCRNEETLHLKRLDEEFFE
ncbi:restriction endonuclease [Magnetovibrio blakemorei]|uniref:Restriction endonuclease n=1 Tax=Magnetovibrio blakemorei TaxID=28181 RepID=A0A1E5Q7G8_9PROT|nr:restriction endonuclease [Magnetovibrio blakemorei]OEJ66579.1 restriction endonuclease [Magnetovibrio blakemorei]